MRRTALCMSKEDRMGCRVGSLLVCCSRNDFRDSSADIKAREALLKKAAEEAKRLDVRALVLPAGFFGVSSVREAQAIADRLPGAVGADEMVVALGIDVRGEAKGLGKAKNEHGATYPYFGVVIERGRCLIPLAQQTGAATDEVAQGVVRSVIGRRIAHSEVLGAPVALLLCGEVLSWSWRSEFHAKAPQFVLHPAHASIPLGGASKESWRLKVGDLLKGLSRTSVWVFADHVAQGWHSDAGKEASLVRVGETAAPAPAVAEAVSVEAPGVGPGGWLYVHAA
ncbi:Hypothetical protein A7982_00501 [Minicystis rosea]|nr:Hypothetical protein A7982_00501 [Minicystis rosea]